MVDSESMLLIMVICNTGYKADAVGCGGVHFLPHFLGSDC